MTDKIVVLVTCGSVKEARKIAYALVEQGLAACVNILKAPMESIYRWKGNVESAKESLLVLKTSRRRFAAPSSVRSASCTATTCLEIIALPIDRRLARQLPRIGYAESVKPPQESDRILPRRLLRPS